MNVLHIKTKECPTLKKLYRWSLEPGHLVVDDDVLKNIQQARESLINESAKRTIYGFHTRLGKLYDKGRLSSQEYEETVIREHAVGVGEYMPPPIGRLFIAIRALQLSKGFTPVTIDSFLRLLKALECGISPAIPSRGSVGASGDLAPSSHVIKELFMGEDHVWFNDELVPSMKALKECGLERYKFERGEALLLINTTAYSTSLLVYSIGYLYDLLDKIYENTNLLGSIVGWNCEHFTKEISLAKEHPGIKKALSKIKCNRRQEPRRLQDPYSLRCFPNILGAVNDTLTWVEQVARWEYCSPSSNPLVINSKVVHQCGFHAVYPGVAMDLLGITISLIGNLVERRSSKLLDETVTGLPRFLVSQNGSVGGMIIHYTIASLAAELRSESAPRTVHNIPTSLDHEDVVSMAPNSGIRVLRMLSLLTREVFLEKALINIASKIDSDRAALVDEIYKDALKRAREFMEKRRLEKFI